MNILIIDDNKHDTAVLKKLLKQIEQKERIRITVETSDILPAYSKDLREFHMIFMNPMINGAESIDLACKIRKYDNNVSIIFTADNLDYAQKGYYANANRYLLKPYDESTFFNEVIDLFWSFIYVHKSIRIFKDEFEIPIHKIMYIEVNHRKTCFYLMGGDKKVTYRPLSDWIKLLEDAPFSRPCRAFYINFSNVKSITQYGIIMRDEKYIPITKSYQDRFFSDLLFYRNRCR